MFPKSTIRNSIINKMQEEEEREEVVQRMESSSSQDDKALKEMNVSTAKEAHQKKDRGGVFSK